MSSRPGALAAGNLTTVYIPELAGRGEYKISAPRRIGLANVTSNTLVF